MPQTEVLILTVHESEQVVREVLQAGAHGYVLKSDAGRDLVAVVKALSQHKSFFTAKVAEMVLAGYLGQGAASGRGGGAPPAFILPRARNYPAARRGEEQ